MAKSDLGAYNIEDLRRQAQKKLPTGLFQFIDGGAEDGLAVQNNREAYTQLKIKNRVLVDVSERSTETEIFGKKIAMPFGISPTGSAGLVWLDGEIGLAEAAAKMNVPCAVALNGLTAMEAIWEKAGGNLWFQIYLWADKEMSLNFLKRVQDVGFETLIVTVDGPVGPNREYNERNGFSMPIVWSPKLFAQLLAKPSWLARVLLMHYLRYGAPKKENYPEELSRKVTDRHASYVHAKSDSQNWDDIKRIRDIWPGNLLIKGLQSAEDAVIAKREGLDGVVLSNHGGRYVDCAPAPLQVLAETRAAVGKDFKLIIDSGARRGSDIVKAIACGADLVMSGRPTLWGAAAAGTPGAYRALEIFQKETGRIMAQLGLNSVAEIGPHIFWNPPDWVPKPGASLKAAAE
jgi:isopentenyl diphosphate isomerase/L-lactate dehydrogenase-like FMN-dependent dehydrogenase